MENRVTNRQTTWYIINIKARRNQVTSHYVQAFRDLLEKDPLINIPRDRCESLKSVIFSELLDDENEPKWIKITLLSYTLIDPNAFYNRRRQEEVSLNDWNSDIVANKKETDLFFIPSVHKLAVRCNSDIKLANIVLYLSEALNSIETDGFDVTVVVDQDILDRIINAYAVYKIEASISFSNPGHTDGFIRAFDTKLRDMNPQKFDIVATGTKENPLNKEADGMLQSIVKLSEENGTVKATIRSTINSKTEKIDSSKHPRKLVIPRIINDICSTIYNEIKNSISSN